LHVKHLHSDSDSDDDDDDDDVWCMFDDRVIKKMNRSSGIAVAETLTDTYSAHGLAVFIASGQLQHNTTTYYYLLTYLLTYCAGNSALTFHPVRVVTLVYKVGHQFRKKTSALKPGFHYPG